MRAHTFVAGMAALVLAGCGAERDSELQRLVSELGAGENAKVWCEWGDWSDDSLHETCLYFVPAPPGRVARQVISKLEAHGYGPACRRDGADIVVVARRDDLSVNADVVADDFPYLNVPPPEEIDVPDGHTALLLRANRPSSEGGRGEHVACP